MASFIPPARANIVIFYLLYILLLSLFVHPIPYRIHLIFSSPRVVNMWASAGAPNHLSHMTRKSVANDVFLSN